MHSWLWVGLGGFAGALLRYALVLIVESFPSTFLTSGVFSTVLVNNAGCFLAGVFSHRITDEVYRSVLIVGFLGSFTTFSAFSREGMRLFYSQAWFLFSGFFLLNVIGSLLSYHAGFHWSK